MTSGTTERCPRCGQTNPRGSRTCQDCGGALVPGRACLDCGHVNPTLAVACENCGMELPEVWKGGAPARTLRAPLGVVRTLRAFQQSLADAVGWCSNQGERTPADLNFRSPELDPVLGRIPATDEWLALRVDHLIRARHAAHREGQGSPPLIDGPRDGRLIAFDFHRTLSDGFAAAVSGGFFDDDNVPPWDTWVAYVLDEGYLLSWVPPRRIPDVARAIGGNPEECIQWAGHRESAFLRLLRRAGDVPEMLAGAPEPVG